MHLRHPAGQRAAVQLHPVAGVDAALAVQRDMVTELAHHHVRQQRRAGQAARDGAAGRKGLEDGLALGAGQLRAHRADDLEATRHVLQMVRHVRAQAAQAAAAGRAATGLAVCVLVRCRGLGTDHLLLARQVLRQAAVQRAGVGRRRRGLAGRQFIQYCGLQKAGLRVLDALAVGRGSC
jgi:hypothetical protein